MPRDVEAPWYDEALYELEASDLSLLWGPSSRKTFARCLQIGKKIIQIKSLVKREIIIKD